MRSSLKKPVSLMIALILLLTACAGAAEVQERRKMETSADADEWMIVFLGDHPETLDGVWQMTAQMESAAVSVGGMSGLAKQIAALGTVEKIFPAYE